MAVASRSPNSTVLLSAERTPCHDHRRCTVVFAQFATAKAFGWFLQMLVWMPPGILSTFLGSGLLLLGTILVVAVIASAITYGVARVIWIVLNLPWFLHYFVELTSLFIGAVVISAWRYPSSETTSW